MEAHLVDAQARFARRRAEARLGERPASLRAAPLALDSLVRVAEEVRALEVGDAQDRLAAATLRLALERNWRRAVSEGRLEEDWAKRSFVVRVVEGIPDLPETGVEPTRDGWLWPR